MRLFVLALVSVIAIFSHAALADDPPPPPMPVNVPSAPEKPTHSKEQLEHLKSAADHLAQAGRKDEAEKLREQITAIESGQAAALLAIKEKELDTLRAEVEQLRKLTRRQPQIVLAFQVFEASRARLNAADSSHVQLLFPGVRDKHQPTVASTAAREAIEALRKKDLLKVLAEPTLVTVSGRQALFNSGGEFPVLGTGSVDFRQFGTRIEALPELIGGGKVRIHVRAKVSEIDPSRTIKVNGSATPGLREQAVQTAAELRFGEALVLNGPARTRVESELDANGKVHTGSDEIVTLVVITPEQVDPEDVAVFPHPVRGSYMPMPTATKANNAKLRK